MRITTLTRDVIANPTLRVKTKKEKKTIHPRRESLDFHALTGALRYQVQLYRMHTDWPDIIEYIEKRREASSRARRKAASRRMHIPTGVISFLIDNDDDEISDSSALLTYRH